MYMYVYMNMQFADYEILTCDICTLYAHSVVLKMFLEI